MTAATEAIGRQILNAALLSMDSEGEVDDIQMEGIDPEVDAARRRLNLSETYNDAWHAFAREFVLDPGGATRELGPFFDDHDVRAGIIDKFHAFYTPISLWLKEQVPDITYTSTVVEPHYQTGQRTDVAIVVHLDHHRTPLLAYFDSQKAWLPFVRGYDTLLDEYGTIATHALIAVRSAIANQEAH